MSPEPRAAFGAYEYRRERKRELDRARVGLRGQANLGVVSCHRADHPTQFSSSHLRRRHTNGETDADLGRAEKFALFPRFSDTSPVRVISDWAERRKVAGPPARTPSVRLRFHKQLFHSFHNEVGNDIWT